MYSLNKYRTYLVVTIMTRKPGWTTIVLAPETRDELRHIARKDQTYDDLLNELIRRQKETIAAAAVEGATLKKT
jgi:hypothetical protein